MTDADLLAIDQRIQRAGAANCWTGTLGSLAADARRLVRHIQEGRAMAEIPVDHILQGEAELRGRRYTGDEAEFVDDEHPRPVLRPLPPVEVVDEIDSRNLAAYVAEEERDFPPLGPPIGQVACCTGPAGWSWSNYTPPAGTPYTPLKRPLGPPIGQVACCTGPAGWSWSNYTPPAGTPYTPLKRPGQKPCDPIHLTSRKYIDLLDKLRELHLSKSADYGTTDDPLANIRNGAAFVGIEPWRACLVRLSDKVTRIGTYCAKGTLTHEGVEDSLLDLAAYSLLTLLLHQEPASSTPPLPPAGTGDD